MYYFLLKALLNSFTIFLVAYLIPGINFTGDFLTLLLAGVVLGLINTLIRPTLKALFFPLIILSLGLFAILINTSLLWLLAKIIKSLTIDGFWNYLKGGLVLSIMNILTSWLIKGHKKDVSRSKY